MEGGSTAGYYFAIDEGTLREKLIPLRAVVSIGRAPENDIRFSDRYVSKRHALVSLIGSEYVIQDVGSRNGVFINGKRVKTAVLRSGDTLQLGNTILRFIYKADTSAAKTDF
jgi:pSer/pThr/pTyr-binding forkhead associated (FHA) protein